MSQIPQNIPQRSLRYNIMINTSWNRGFNVDLGCI